MEPKFKIGDKVIPVGDVFESLGRPKVRIIEKIVLKGEEFCYGGKLWLASEENLVLESEFEYPSESEMEFMDKKAKEEFQNAFKILKE